MSVAVPSSPNWTMPPEYRNAVRIPERLGRFDIVGLLGAGGMGDVYSAQDRTWGTPVALKTVGDAALVDPTALRNEFRATAQLRHPNLVSLYELGCDGNTWFFTMEWLRGATIGELSATDMRLPRIIAELAAVVDAIHGEGLLHLDIKPSNIVMRGDSPVLLDFGIARHLNAGNLASAPLIGTPGFIAPERMNGSLGPAADWYALGVSLQRILGRESPAGPLHELASRWTREDPSSRGGWSDAATLLGAAPIPFVLRLRTSKPTPVGRRVELAHLATAWRELHGPRLVTLRGVPGVGKSWLAEMFSKERAETDAAVVLNVRCHPREPTPLRIVDALLEALGMPARPAVSASTDAWARWAGLDRCRDLSEALTHAFHSAVAKLSERRPVVLVLRDVQWADTDSARVLGDALERAPNAPVLVVATWSATTNTEEPSPFIRELQVRLRSRDIVLLPLAAEDAARWLTEAAPATLPASSESIVAKSGGLPFLMAQGADGLARVLADLNPEEQALLETIAVAGMPLPLSLAVRATSRGASAVDTVTRLESRGLIVVDGIGGADEVECRHPLIREAVEATLDRAARISTHRLLAEQSDPGSPRSFLAHNLLGSGDAPAGAQMARLGAEEASRRGAFVLAAQLWGLAATAHPAPGDWANASAALLAGGHRAEAADVILENRSDEDGRVEAGGHLLAAGAVDRGREVLAPVLRRLGIADPQSAAGAAWRGLLALGHIAWLERRARPVEGAAERARLAWLLARGLLATDAFVGMYFALVGLAFALRSPDRAMGARLGAVVGTVILAPLGGPFERWGASMLARAAAASAGDRTLEGVVSLGRCQQALLAGRWGLALMEADIAAGYLKDAGDDSSWELEIAELGAIRALEELGQLDDALRRSARLRHTGHRRGTLYSEVTGMLYEAGNLLHVGEVEAARHLVKTARRLWPFAGFHMQHAYATRVEVTALLYEREGAQAAAQVERMWPALEASRLMQIPMVHFDMWELRARAALAAGDRKGATAAVDTLLRSGKPYARAWAQALDATCLRRSSPNGALAALDAAEMHGRADTLRFVLDSNEAPLRRRGVADPVSWARAQLPSL